MTVQLKPNHVLVDKRGRPTAVVLSIVNYRKLLHLVEDAGDAKALRRAVRTRRSTLTHEQLLERLKRQELL